MNSLSGMPQSEIAKLVASHMWDELDDKHEDGPVWCPVPSHDAIHAALLRAMIDLKIGFLVDPR